MWSGAASSSWAGVAAGVWAGLLTGVACGVVVGLGCAADGHLDWSTINNLHFAHVLLSGPARLFQRVLVCGVGRGNDSSTEGRYDAREG
ncbi:hypothetical protein V6N12_074876 [Hibiscus sabdariffa]|uniref:Uncharacterized protein n=1 Tax=Hibiscus sabdariffa TaxID=183260 RepID=A0ABR2D4F5_9ROSI